MGLRLEVDFANKAPFVDLLFVRPGIDGAPPAYRSGITGSHGSRVPSAVGLRFGAATDDLVGIHLTHPAPARRPLWWIPSCGWRDVLADSIQPTRCVQ